MSVWQGLLDIAERSGKTANELRLERLAKAREAREALEKETRAERSAALKQIQDARRAAHLKLRELKRRQIEEQIQRVEDSYLQISKAYTENLAKVLEGLDNGTYAEDIHQIARKLLSPLMGQRSSSFTSPLYEIYGIDSNLIRGATVIRQAVWLEHVFGSTADKWIEAHLRFKAKRFLKDLKKERTEFKSNLSKDSTFTEMLLSGELKNMMLSKSTLSRYERLNKQLKEFDDEQRKPNADSDEYSDATRLAQGGISDPDPSRTGLDHRSDAFIRDADVQHARVHHST